MKRKLQLAGLVLLLLMVIIGCQKADTMTPTEVALLYIDALGGKTEGLKQYDPNALPEGEIWQESLKSQSDVTFSEAQANQFAANATAAIERADVKVLSETINGNKATLNLEVVPVDYYSNLITKAGTIDWTNMTDEQINEAMVNLINDSLKDAPLVPAKTSKVEVTMTKNGDIWVMDESSASPLINKLILFSE